MRLVDDVDALWSGRADAPGWLFTIDGRGFVIERGVDGDFRMEHGTLVEITAECETPGTGDFQFPASASHSTFGITSKGTCISTP